jgi:aminoglycoside 6'-N-acetyltransferase I
MGSMVEVVRIIDLTSEAPDLIEQAAVILRDAFRNRTEDWQDLDSARQEVMESLAPDRISRVALDESGKVVGWIGAFPSYRGRVWELHPIVVTESHRRRGIGTALVEDLERLIEGRGALTLWLGGDDENGETSVSGVDLYADVPGAIRDLKKLRGEHPLEFYRRLGFRVTGVVPDANGRGRPDIFFAKCIGDPDKSSIAADRRIDKGATDSLINDSTTATEFLFSYGTLQLERVQMATFGRRLTGIRDALPGFERGSREIDDAKVAAELGKTHYAIARFTGRTIDAVDGTVFAVTTDEIQRADDYEVAGYKRVSVALRSGTRAWVYVDEQHVPPES